MLSLWTERWVRELLSSALFLWYSLGHWIQECPTNNDREFDNRPRISNHFAQAQSGPRPPTIQSDYPVTYWSDTQIGTSVLKNLGNTCYMNSTIQCLSATVPFSRFFTDGRWKSAVNMVNPMGTKGNLANAFANILRDLWQGEGAALSPVTFRVSVAMYAYVERMCSADPPPSYCRDRYAATRRSSLVRSNTTRRSS